MSMPRARGYIQRGPSISSSLKDDSIASVGGGLRYWFPYNIVADTEVARTLEAVPGSDGGKLATSFSSIFPCVFRKEART